MHHQRARQIAVAVLPLAWVMLANAQSSKRPARAGSPEVSMPSAEDIQKVSPALARYTQGIIKRELWERPDLSRRDRSLVILAAVIARNQTTELPHNVTMALDNGVKPSEVSETITHLAFYCGWPNVLSAVVAAKDIFQKRGIGADQLPPAKGDLLPMALVHKSRHGQTRGLQGTFMERAARSAFPVPSFN